MLAHIQKVGLELTPTPSYTNETLTAKF